MNQNPSANATTHRSVDQQQACSAPGVRVEMKDLRRVMACLAIVESVPLEDVTWLENGEPIPVTKEELADWKFTGLNNRDFALIHLEGRKAQNDEMRDGEHKTSVYTTDAL